MKEYIHIYKGYQIKPDKTNPMSYVVVTDGKGGKVPDCLNGMFTSRGVAKIEIDTYTNGKSLKEEVNAETVSKSRSK